MTFPTDTVTQRMHGAARVIGLCARQFAATITLCMSAIPWVANAQTNVAEGVKRSIMLVCAVLLVLAGASVQAEVPDLTKGGKPVGMSRKSEKLLVGNLGPTGLKGWVFHKRIDTSQSRQILITSVDEGSPADGTLAVGDVILGADGSGAAPKPFSTDARRSFARAIADAEARDPATLKMIRWREGETATVAITLETMGAYSDTAPYNCPKSRKIIEKALRFLEKNELNRDRFGFNTLTMLAFNDERIPGNAERMKRARERIIETLPTTEEVKWMTSDQVETGSKVAWRRGYGLIVLAEYYLATGENPSKDGVDLLTAIDAHAQTIAKGQSMYGTMGHQFAVQKDDGSIHGPYLVGYGPVNASGLAAFLGLTLARDCKLPNAETHAKIEAGIQRAATFFASYAGRGSIPYGEHPPWTNGHSSNGKNGQAALIFARVPGREKESRYFSMMSVAAGAERVGGHGGAFFKYTWAPLGANAGGPEAAAAHFRHIRWHLDLSRTWKGAFFYNDYGNPGYHGPTFGKAGMYMSTPALLTYAMPLRKLAITGRGLGEKTQLSKDQAAQAFAAGIYDPAGRTGEQLVADLSSFSVVVRNRAAEAFAQKPDARTLLPRLHQIAADVKHPSRLSAIKAIGVIGQADSSPVLTKLLSDADQRVREEAIKAFGTMPRDVREAQVDTFLKMAADLRRPPLVVHKEDPMNTGLLALTHLLFNKEDGILTQGLDPVDKYSSREQLYAAIRGVATLPSGGKRGDLKYVFPYLSKEDVRALSDTLLELIYVEGPADAMFAKGIRYNSVQLLLKHRFTEGVKASVDLFNSFNYFRARGTWPKMVIIGEWEKLGRSVTTIEEGKDIPALLEACRRSKETKLRPGAEKALKSIADDSKPIVTFTPLKDHSK